MLSSKSPINLDVALSNKKNNTHSNEVLVGGPVTFEQNLFRASQNEQEKYEQDSFWVKPKIDPLKWDKYCPYQLIILRYVLNTPDDPEGGGQYKPYSNWQFTLPLPPESLH